MIEHYISKSATRAWLREMRSLEHDGDLEFEREREQLRPVVSRDFVQGAADEATKVAA